MPNETQPATGHAPGRAHPAAAIKPSRLSFSAVIHNLATAFAEFRRTVAAAELAARRLPDDTFTRTTSNPWGPPWASNATSATTTTPDTSKPAPTA